ncbi:MAG: hypothetical protein LUQ04_08080 [Methanoregula sp.]|nr:hypothetical protein [Methanoregula sp.]
MAYADVNVAFNITVKMRRTANVDSRSGRDVEYYGISKTDAEDIHDEYVNGLYCPGW